jgi:hypothetical protein
MEYLELTRDLIYGQQRFMLIVEDGTIIFPTGYWDYGTIVDTLIKERYPSDRMEAVTNNYLANQADMESAQAYTEMLRYRGECKVLARELMRYSVDHGLALPEFVEAFEPTENTRSMVLQKIQNYDMSDNVNGFILGGQQEWLTKPQRESLLTSLNMFVKAGVETFPFVLGGRAMELPCATLEQMLAAVEVYATQCMMVTANHTAKVSAMRSEQRMLDYDYTTGYPEMMEFNV